MSVFSATAPSLCCLVKPHSTPHHTNSGNTPTGHIHSNSLRPKRRPSPTISIKILTRPRVKQRDYTKPRRFRPKNGRNGGENQRKRRRPPQTPAVGAVCTLMGPKQHLADPRMLHNTLRRPCSTQKPWKTENKQLQTLTHGAENMHSNSQ